MFNGLIREIAKVKSFDGKFLNLEAKFKPNLGDSIAINGACLSVVSLQNDGFSVELSSESSKVLALENYKDKVHMEPAMKIGDRIDGHLLQGHIDAVGEITSIKNLPSGTDFFVKLPKDVMHLVANKGSIAVEGVSLTINEVLQNVIRLTIIPISLKDTLFGEFKVGRRVNVETDLLARYTDRILSMKNKKNNGDLSWQEADFYASLY
ncbi:riboflavin synthase [Campylobacter fetus]|uniref:riboflavin synthase n=1 Tax=Campylobacter fetus TaxID=196 RepID=UPI000818BB3B|nr:riboflavin synthase [Campylobacter fetus]EAK0829382.1 riboflavin synthase [Campylobacter fetus]OCR92186.1 riboflavin synthase subunit alpha [Campylobacter fetus subsp. testudinum]OCR98561.1 riboflavin synthase subunit alpha [Campylobacter fetus subsp. testudinum]OCS00981.1 riboflavin synthase subunit alpha [Campylobacter fetus subsp. testudinum]OCS03814.1 riboflavin synthase subunit alpha [Campylobacter fetus subsp. testudinum]